LLLDAAACASGAAVAPAGLRSPLLAKKAHGAREHNGGLENGPIDEKYAADPALWLPLPVSAAKAMSAFAPFATTIMRRRTMSRRAIRDRESDLLG
jgi:hypothetical protein